MTARRRPTAVRRGPALLWASLALLTGTAAGSLWFAPPLTSDQWVIWAVMVGGCLAAACAVAAAGREVTGGREGSTRLEVSAAARLLAVSAAALLSAPLALAVGARGVAVALAVLASTVTVPLAALRVVETRPATRLLRWADGGVVVTGAGCTMASAWGGQAAGLSP